MQDGTKLDVGVMYPKIRRGAIDLRSGRRRGPMPRRIESSPQIQTKQRKSTLRGQEGFHKCTVTTTAKNLKGEVGL